MKQKNTKKYLNDTIVLAAHARHTAGESITKLSLELNVHSRTLHRRFVEMGLWVRPWNEARNGQKTLPPVTPEQATQAAQLLKDGKTKTNVAKEMGIAWHRLEWAILKQGLNIQIKRVSNTSQLTPEKLEVIKQYKTSNITKEQLAEKLQLPLSTIKYWLYRLNLRRYRRSKGENHE